jgi:hypothetical protein
MGAISELDVTLGTLGWLTVDHVSGLEGRDSQWVKDFPSMIDASFDLKHYAAYSARYPNDSCSSSRAVCSVRCSSKHNLRILADTYL